MANKYKIAGAGNWGDDTQWSTTDGGPNDTTKPTAADDVFLTANSGNINGNSSNVCRSLNCTGYTGTYDMNFFGLTIGDATAGASNIALKFVGAMTLTEPGLITFVSTSATVQTVDFAGKQTGSVTFDAASNGSWQYTGSHTVATASTLTLTRGTLDTNGQTCSWGTFSSSNSNTRTLTLGASNITLTAAGASFVTTGTPTITPNTATITMSGAGAILSTATNLVGTTVIANGSGIFSLPTTSISLANFTRTGTAVKTDSIQLRADITCTGTFTCNSNSDINRVQIFSNTVGTARTITAATVVITNTVDFQDITGAGAATWTVAGTGATYLGDCGGNSGITFTTGATQTLTMSTNKNWDDVTIWTSRVPLPQDNVSFAGVTGGILSTNGMPRLGKDIDCTGVTGSFTWSPNIASFSIYGSLTLISGMTFSTSNNVTFAGRGTHTITMAGKSFSGSTVMGGSGGTYTLQDAFTTSIGFSLSGNNFNTNGYTVTSSTMSFVSNLGARTLTLGTSIWNLTSTATATVWDLNSASITLSGDSSNIVISTTSTNTRTFNPGTSKTYGTLTYTLAGSTGGLDITTATSFAAIYFSDANNARTLRFTAGITTVIRSASGWQVNGTSGRLMTVSSITAATHTISCASGNISSDYLNVINSVATGGATFYAGRNSTNGGGNTGWLFVSFFSQELTEAITSDDDLLLETGRVLTEAIPVSETFTRMIGKNLTEELTLVDVISRSFSIIFTETMTMVDKLTTLLDANRWANEDTDEDTIGEEVLTSKRNYLTIAELQEYADVTITDDEEGYDRITQAEEIIDAYVGPQDRAVQAQIEGMAVSGGSNTLTLQVDQQNIYEIDYLIYCTIEILGGTGAGQQRRITGQTKEGVLTFDRDWITTPDATSFYRIYQLGKFPRYQDQSYYSYTSPFRYYKLIPEAIKRATAAQVEYMIKMGDEFFSTDRAQLKRERIDDYEYETHDTGSLSSKLIAPKAKMYLRGIRSRIGQILI